MKKMIFLCLLLTQIFQMAFATHNRAAEITFKQTGVLTFEATIHTYTNLFSLPADRDSLEICWGDGLCEWVVRSNGPNGEGETIDGTNKYNQYISTHTYAVQNTYTLSMTDPNRNGDILNIGSFNSDNIPMHVQTTFTITETFNSSPTLLQMPIDFGTQYQPFYHSPNGFDVDDDSISYQLIVPLQAANLDVPNYIYPHLLDEEMASLEIDPVTGLITWESPQWIGQHTIAILVTEYRNGEIISEMIRDMLIDISDMDNIIPFVNSPIVNLTYMANSTINFEVTGDDALHNVKITATGGPFEVAQPATFTSADDFQEGPITAQFNWTPNSNHVKENAYQLVFKIEDQLGGIHMQVIRFHILGDPASTSNLETLKVNLWPNPTADAITLELEKGLSNAQIQIINTAGKHLLNQQRSLDQKTILMIPNLASGIYFLKIEAKEGFVYRKFVVKE